MYDNSTDKIIGCLYYSIPGTKVDEFEMVRNLFKTTRTKYVIVEDGAPREMSQGEKDLVDAEEAEIISSAKSIRDSITNKFKQLGFTDDEIKILFGST